MEEKAKDGLEIETCKTRAGRKKITKRPAPVVSKKPDGKFQIEAIRLKPQQSRHSKIKRQQE